MARTAMIGLGAMGQGMARNIMQAGVALTGYDVSDQALHAFAQAGGLPANSAAEASAEAALLVVMVANGAQAQAALFESGAAAALAPKAVVVLCSTIAPSEARAIAKQLADMGHMMIDAPVSGGQVGADAGTLTVMASGPDPAFDRAAAILGAISKTVHRVGDAPGLGATYKVVHQLAAGVHLVAAAELLALGVKAGCDAETLFDIVMGAAGQSWMLGDRGPRMMTPDPPVTSSVDIFIKDLGLVVETGADAGMELPLAQTALTMMQRAGDMGMGRRDDSTVIKVYEAQAGTTLRGGTSTKGDTS